MLLLLLTGRLLVTLTWIASNVLPFCLIRSWSLMSITSSLPEWWLHDSHCFSMEARHYISCRRHILCARHMDKNSMSSDRMISTARPRHSHTCWMLLPLHRIPRTQQSSGYLALGGILDRNAVTLEARPKTRFPRVSRHVKCNGLSGWPPLHPEKVTMALSLKALGSNAPLHCTLHLMRHWQWCRLTLSAIVIVRDDRHECGPSYAVLNRTGHISCVCLAHRFGLRRTPALEDDQRRQVGYPSKHAECTKLYVFFRSMRDPGLNELHWVITMTKTRLGNLLHSNALSRLVTACLV